MDNDSDLSGYLCVTFQTPFVIDCRKNCVGLGFLIYEQVRFHRNIRECRFEICGRAKNVLVNLESCPRAICSIKYVFGKKNHFKYLYVLTCDCFISPYGLLVASYKLTSHGGDVVIF